MTAVRWRKIAEQLADRLAVHAFCERHPASTPDKDCPFCQDRAAYQAYLKAGGQDCRPRPPAGPAVSIAELWRQLHGEAPSRDTARGDQ